MTELKDKKPVEILLVEDNEGDVLLTKKAFEQAKIKNNISVARDGEQAIQILTDRAEESPPFRPDIILLDINLPRKDGKQVLKEIKEHEYLKHIPVVVLTSSEAEKDVAMTYKLHANSYIVKPINLEKFHKVVSAIESFWFEIVVLPPSRIEEEKI